MSGVKHTTNHNQQYATQQHQSSSTQHHQSSSILLKYQFLISLLIEHLDDKDVLTSLLLINKHIRTDLHGYSVKRFIQQRDVSRVASIHHYLPVKVNCLHVSHLPIVLPYYCDLSALKKLKFVEQFRQHIAVGSIPASVTHLEFGFDFDQPILIGLIPFRSLI